MVKSSIIHAYLALNHPFSDGNERIIRLLVNKYINKFIDYDLFIDNSIDDLEIYSKMLSNFREFSDDNLYFHYHLALINSSFNKFINYTKILYSKFYDIYWELYDVIPRSKLNEMTHFILVNNIFTISKLERDIKISRVTATKYAKNLYEKGIYKKERYKNGFIYKKDTEYRF